MEAGMTDARTRLLSEERGVHRAEARYLDQDQASEYLSEKGLKIAAKTLGKLRVTGGGPAYRKFGRKPIYDPLDLELWVNQKLGAPRRSTSEAA
jgi:hypothetical protein